MKDVLPAPILRDIGRHLVRAGHRAEEGFPSGEEEEDTLSGDFLRAVRKRWSRDVPINGATWRWRVTTRKFRGRGELATESLIGADGIVQVEVVSPDGTVTRKGLLFQAKNQWRHRDQDLLDQIKLMDQFAPDGGAVFNYGPDRYTASSTAAVVAGNARPGDSSPKRLGEFLAEDFLGCIVGRRDTWYDWEAKGLVVPSFPQLPFGAVLSPQFLVAIQATARLT